MYVDHCVMYIATIDIFLKIKRFYINDIGLFFSAFGAVLISAFPFSIVHEYIHFLSYPKKSRK